MCHTGVGRFHGRQLCSTGGRILKMQSGYSSTVAAGILTEIAFIWPSNPFSENSHPGCAALLQPTRSYPRFSAGSNDLSRLIQHPDTHMPDGAGTHEATGEELTELVIALPHGGVVTVQFNPYLAIEHPNIRFVLCVNALWVGLWKYVAPNPTPTHNLNAPHKVRGKG